MEEEETKANMVNIMPLVAQPALTQWILTFEDIINWLEHDMRGEVFNINTGAWERVSKPIMNEIGIRELISTIRSFINKVTFLSNLDDEYINEIVCDIELEINRILFLKYEKYGIEKNNLSIIKRRLIYPIFLALRWSKNKGMLEALTKTVQVKELTNVPPETKKGFFGLFGRKI